MCVSAIVDGDEITSAGKLRQRLGRRNVVIRDGYGAVPFRSCLCPVDVRESARLAGYSAKRDDFGDWVLNRHHGA